ncbi:MAG: T9SS type A sorting domain-containing protein [Bacteroidales bacterium]|nr:T9SS type A sorting domain-containing protein [Bacteroidales bacterium]MCF8334534.1 T9SS type A sorting domain-containing protein [Bacteroidales bacterium]
MLKRLFLYTAIILWTGTGLIAQNLELSTEEQGVLEDGQVLTVEGSPDDNLITGYVKVTNTGNDSIRVLVRKEENNLVGDAVSFFCWGQCYTPSIDTSTNHVTIHAGETNTEFSGDYQPEGNAGTSSVTYYFYNEDNPEEEISVEMHFVAETESTLRLSTDEGILEHEEEVEVEGTIDSSLLVFHANVTNTGEDTLQVEAARVENSLVDSTVNYFCWGLCYTPSVDTATQTITIPPGDSTDAFDGDYEPQGKSGTSSISYYFYDVRNPDNKVGVEVKYVVETSGIGDENNIITDLRTYPVPADNRLNVEYTLEETQQAMIKLSTLAGKTVYKQPISSGSKKTRINTSRFENGLYLLTIMQDNFALQSRKVVISH